jgi:hypothetical protein
MSEVADDPNMPFVAVIGGLWQLDETRAAAARNAGKILGTELAKAGFGLVVYFSNDASLEPHVVTGYVEALNGSGGAIRVRYAESQQGEVNFREEESQPELFEHRLFPGLDWEVPFYRSVAEEEGVDGVVLLGGATSTLIAGQIAVARRLPVLAVNEFGGSAAKIWNQLAQASPNTNYPSWAERRAGDLVKRLKKECAEGAARREQARRRERAFASITAQRTQVAYAAVAFAALLAWLFLGMVYTPLPPAYPFITFLGLISAGATGALIRAVLSGTPGGNDPRASLLLGGVAGFVVGLAYLIPQWIGAPGVLEAKATAVSATDKIQFASAVLVAVSAGVGFDTVFSRLQRQAQDTAITPPT